MFPSINAQQRLVLTNNRILVLHNTISTMLVGSVVQCDKLLSNVFDVEGGLSLLHKS